MYINLRNQSIVRFERIVSGRFSLLTAPFTRLPAPLQSPAPPYFFKSRSHSAPFHLIFGLAPLHFPLPLRSHALFTVQNQSEIRNRSTDTESVLKFRIVQKFQNICRSVSESFQDFRMHIKFQNHSNVSESILSFRITPSFRIGYCFRISPEFRIVHKFQNMRRSVSELFQDSECISNFRIALMFHNIGGRHNYNNETCALLCFMSPQVSKRWGSKNFFARIVPPTFKTVVPPLVTAH